MFNDWYTNMAGKVFLTKLKYEPFKYPVRHGEFDFSLFRKSSETETNLLVTL